MAGPSLSQDDMANPTSVYYTGDGATTDRVFPFPYLSKDHVKVTVDGVATVFTFVNASTVRITPAPLGGTEPETIRIYRETPKDPLVEWEDGAVMLGRDLNSANIQNIYIAEEAYNQALSVAEEAKQFALNSIQTAIDLALQQSETRLAAVIEAPAANAVAAALTATQKAADAATALALAQAQVTLAQGHATDAATAKTGAETSLNSFRKTYYGELSANPTADVDGNPPKQGALFFHSIEQRMKVYDGSQWVLAYNALTGLPTIYDTNIVNTSSVGGASVKEALETLLAAIAALSATTTSSFSTVNSDLATKASTVALAAAEARLDGRVDATWSMAAAKQAALGFTPVRQGGGAGQGTNTVYIGWGASSVLKAQVDATDLGELVTASRLPTLRAAQGVGGLGTYAHLKNTAGSVGPGNYQNGSNLQWAGAGNTGNERTSGVVNFGTWLCMGTAPDNATQTLWLRVA